MMRFIANRWLHIAILLGLLGGLVTVHKQETRLAKAMSYLAFDGYNKLRPRMPTDRVVMVDIDETSMERDNLGQWPWPRDVMAQLVTNLKHMGARAIVFDMVFPEPDRTSPAALYARLPADVRHAELAQTLQDLPDHDAVFAQAVKDAGNVVMGFIWTFDPNATRRTPPVVKPINMRGPVRALEKTAARIPGAVTNLPAFSAAAAGEGNFGVSADIDGIIRRVPLLFRYNDPETGNTIMYPSLAVEALRVFSDPRSMVNIRALKPDEIGDFTPPLMMRVGSYEVPMDWDAQIIGYFAPARYRQYIPAWRVIENDIDPARIYGKVVFIGASAEGLKDIRSTPLDLFVPGVEFHINVAEQIMNGDYLLRPSIVHIYEVLAMIVVGCLIIILVPFVGAVYMAALVTTLIAAVVGGSFYSFEMYGLLIDPVFPSLSFFLIFAVGTLLTYIRTEYERSRVRQAFGLYISPDFMEELSRDPDKLKLGGETRDLTVMFTDIRSFTTISESLSPEELTQLMNDFLTPMSDLVMETRGTIDKYMGDAMMAFWNAPLHDPDHARHACIAALRMFDALRPVNDALALKAQELGRAPVVLNAGIGLNTGPASVGNMGSKQRFAYSALGDNVNLASRLESQTKAYGVNILISAATRDLVPDFAALEMDEIRVKGKTEPVRIYTLIGDEKNAASADFQRWEAIHKEMMAAYRAQNWTRAVELMADCRTAAEGKISGFYDMFAERIEEMRAQNLPADWDGVYTATSK